MTLVSAIIKNAYRDNNLIAISANPTTNEVAEGVTALNQFIGSLLGHELGMELVDVVVAAATAEARANERLVVTYNSGNVTIDLPPMPENGAVVQVVDPVVGGSRTITLDGNGRMVGGAASAALSAGTNAVYMYRADLGDWLLIAPLEAADELPFPVSFEPLFELAVLIRISPRHGQTATEQQLEIYKREIARLAHEYRQTGEADEPRLKALLNRALTRAGLVPENGQPRHAQLMDAVRRLDAVIDGLYGQELVDTEVTAATYTGRMNERAMVSYNSGDVTITLPAVPDNGARFQVTDTVIGGSRSIILSANGRQIEEASSVTVSAGSNIVWMYRADTGNWVRLAPLDLTDDVPFDEVYDPLLEHLLVMRLNPAYHLELTEAQLATLQADIQFNTERFEFEYRQTGQADEPRTRALLNRALKMAGLVPENGQPRAAQLSDALRRLNAAVDSVYGWEVGEPLTPFPIGQSNVNVPHGYPEKPMGDWWLPINTRLVVNATEPLTIDLHPDPMDGSRFAVVDASGNLSTHNLTLRGNGRLIESGATLTLNTNNVSREWIYRAEIGEWVRLSPIELTGEPPFGEEFDQLFEIETAIRLNPGAIDQKWMVARGRMLAQLKARYKQSQEFPCELGLLLTPAAYTNGRFFHHGRSSKARFTSGYPFTW